jgi:hypothetical protein
VTRPRAAAWWRRARLGLPTVLGLRPRGFFIPYRYADRMPLPGALAPYGAVEAVLQAHAPAFLALLDDLRGLTDAFAAMGGPPPAPRWAQDWFPRLDAAVAYALVRRRQPARIIEVGSGHSTRFMARAIADGGLATALTAVDPAPRASLGGLPVRWHAAAVPSVEPAVFSALAPGDILFIDSSHLLLPGTDADFLFNRVLPALPAGALVHVHDIFLPDDYPADWAWRGYNEQLAVAPLLTGGGWRPLFASRYVATRHAAALAASAVATLPLPAGALESSLWLERIDGF